MWSFSKKKCNAANRYSVKNGPLNLDQAGSVYSSLYEYLIVYATPVFLKTISTLVHCRKLSSGHQVILILTAEKTSEPENFLFDLEIVLSNS